MTEILIPLIVFLFPLAYSPGPGNLAFAANGARFGLRATLPATAGYHLATWAVTVAIGLGAMRAFGAVPGLFTLAKLAGAAYVMWLALQFLRAGLANGPVSARPIGFRDGVVLLLLNPKAIVIITLMFSQFLDESADPALALGIATVFTLNNLLAFTIWTLAGDRLLSAFRTEEHARSVNMAFGLTLGAVAIWMLL